MDWKVLGFCLFSYFVNYGFSRIIIIDFNEAINEVLTKINISTCDATSREKLLARKVVEERIQNDVEKQQVELEKQRADRHERNLTDAYELIGALRGEKNEGDKYKLLLAVRKRVDNLEKMLAPGIFLPKARQSRWEMILKLENEHARMFRLRMEKKGIDPALFPTIVSSIICKDANENAAHPNIPMPKNVTEDLVRDALEVMEIPADEPTIQSYILLAEVLPHSENVTRKYDSAHSTGGDKYNNQGRRNYYKQGGRRNYNERGGRQNYYQQGGRQNYYNKGERQKYYKQGERRNYNEQGGRRNYNEQGGRQNYDKGGRQNYHEQGER